TVVDETLLASPVMLAQGALLGLLPVLVASAELGVTVAAVGHTGGVLLPQQLPGHALALELLVQAGPVRLFQSGGRTHIGARIETAGQLFVVQFLGQRPGQVQAGRLGGELLDGPDTELGAGANLAYRQPGGLQSQYISNFTHGYPLGWHASSGQRGGSVQVR